MNTSVQFRLPTPLGEMTALASAQGLHGLWFDDQKHHPGRLDAEPRAQHPLRDALQTALHTYFAGRGLTLDLPLAPRGTPFQQAVWHALLAIPQGATRSYGDLARELNAPKAVRAVGAAVGRNPLSILVPCHRILGSDGSLTGYAGGLSRKHALLRLEGVALPPLTPSLC